MTHCSPDKCQISATATHFPILAAMVNKTTGPVIELGVGHYSTPMLHFMCQKRPLLSVDTYKEWVDFFAKDFQNDHHTFECTNNQLISSHFFYNSPNKRGPWDVAFVDNGPEVDRAKCVNMLRERKTKYIVVHDSEPLAVAYGWGKLFESFKYRFYWDFYGNGTTVVSDTDEIGLV